MKLKEQSIKDWAKFLDFFTQVFSGRKTRLGVFENGNDLWIESGLPFIGADIDAKTDKPTVQLMLGELTHAVSNVSGMQLRFTATGEEDGLDLKTADGQTTILRFESLL